MATLESFSGAHPFRPQCVVNAVVEEWAGHGPNVKAVAIERAATIATKLGEGVCPRCDGPLDLSRTAGSRSTRCRCVPICPRCGEDEANQAILATGWSQVWRWPLRKGDITRRRNKMSKLGTRTVGLVTVSGDEVSVLTEDGFSRAQMRPNPGGWAEFGYDDAPDVAEQTGVR